MLKITIPEIELFDNETSTFFTVKRQELVLEHSLVSLSKWEAKWCKPYLGNRKTDERTAEEDLDYVRCMTITQNVDPMVYHVIPLNVIREIKDYIDKPMTATWFNEHHSSNAPGHMSTVITSELIYYWMIQYNIPFECQKWHLNRLFTLIRICAVKSNPEKKMSNAELIAHQRELNAKRRAALNSKG